MEAITKSFQLNKNKSCPKRWKFLEKWAILYRNDREVQTLKQGFKGGIPFKMKKTLKTLIGGDYYENT